MASKDIIQNKLIKSLFFKTIVSYNYNKADFFIL